MAARGIRRRHALLGAALLLVSVGAGCDGNDGDDGDDGAAATTTTVTVGDATTTTAVDADTTTTREATTTTTPVDDELHDTAEGVTDLEQLALDLLILPPELGGGAFTDAGYVPVEGPNGCGIDVDGDVPPVILVGTRLVDDAASTITEELRVYDDVTVAAQAQAAHAAGLDCGGDADGTTYGPATDVNDVVGADAAVSIEVTGPSSSGLVVVAQVGDAVLTFDLTITDPGLAPLDVAAFGVGKVLAALEG